jgi:hypothetical protein
MEHRNDILVTADNQCLRGRRLECQLRRFRILLRASARGPRTLPQARRSVRAMGRWITLFLARCDLFVRIFRHRSTIAVAAAPTSYTWRIHDRIRAGAPLVVNAKD